MDEPARRGFKNLTEQLYQLKDFAANPRQRIPTGIQALDDLIWGPAEGEVATFIARSGVGKSLIATNIMVNNPDSKLIFFSLEMPAHMCIMRMWAHQADRPHDEVFKLVYSNTIPDEAFDLANALPYHVVVDEPGLTLDDMTVYIERYAEYYGDRPDAVVIDYLEEVGGAKASGEGWTRTEATASALKVWARKQRVGVYSLHQANMKTEPWEPVMQSSAKGGGFTESDIVVGLWKPGRDPDLGTASREARKNDLSMNVIKNRITGRLEDELHCLITPSMRVVGLYDEPKLYAVQDEPEEAFSW